MSRFSWCAAGVIIAVVSSPAAAQSISDPVERLIEKLQSTDFVDRELATSELRSLPQISLEDIEATLTVDDLSLEQRRRLTMAARLRFLTEPRAAMGITLGPVTELGLRIEGATPGFDTAEKLEAGDLISSIDGVPIRALTDLQIAIISNAPGAVVPVEFVRDGIAGEVQIVLGAWHDLPQAGASPRSDVLELAWIHRSRSYRSLTDPKTIPSLGTPVSGEASSLPAGTRRGVRRDRPIAGGEARDNAPNAAGIDVNRRLSPRLEERGTDFADLVAATLQDLKDRVTQKRDRIARLERDATRLKDRGDVEALNQLQTRRDQLYRELGILLDQIDRYESVREDSR